MIQCPKCHLEIPPDDFNVATDRAWCAKCRKVYSFAEISENELAISEATPSVDWSNLPKWAKLEPLKNPDGLKLILKPFSRLWFLLLPVTLAWSIGWIVLMLMILMNDGIQHYELVIYFLLALLMNLWLISFNLFAVAGHIVLECQAGELRIFSGTWGIGRRTKINLQTLEKCIVQKPVRGGRRIKPGFLKFYLKSGQCRKNVYSIHEERLILAGRFVMQCKQNE